jgi:hypothetical protein
MLLDKSGAWLNDRKRFHVSVENSSIRIAWVVRGRCGDFTLNREDLVRYALYALAIKEMVDVIVWLWFIRYLW